MCKTTVVNKHHGAKYDVYIGRGKNSKWGNPFSHMEGTTAQYKVRNRDEAVRKYGEWLLKQPNLMKDLHELKGKVLGCFCKPQACHGDILANLANGLDAGQNLKDFRTERYTTICFTGQRPQDLYGFDENQEEVDRIKEWLYDTCERLLWRYKRVHFIAGGALGVDTWAAEAVLQLRSDYAADPDYDVTLEIAVPCQGHSSRWRKAAVKRYDAINEAADEVSLVTDAPYSARLMNVRNEYMVDNADAVIAVWNGVKKKADGSNSGTYNCLKYAHKQKKPVIILHPFKFTERKFKPGEKIAV